MGEPTAHFPPAFFGFLKELEKNNNREWFQANKARYEATVQEPCLRFIRDAGARIRSLTPHLVADPRPFGGSLSRIYRDTRFSPDKSPYKTEVGIHFSHGKARPPEHMSPGLYLHLASGESFAASGVWHPDPPTLKRIRDRIVDRPAEWKAVLRSKPRFDGESLKRNPPGYDADHPFIFDLRRKDFVATVPFTDRAVTSAGFLDDFLAACTAMDPLNGFLAHALGIPW